ncbi:MAG: hypothetical protein RL748_437 [Pseudomonadota bacterium]|jgi:serine/threonine-protein kinase
MLQTLGKYRIDATLGKGAMGVVYKGFDPHIERVVALKTIRKDLLEANPEMGLIARFKNEAQAAGRLSHPNIVAVYEYGESDDTAYIAMEFVHNTPLTKLLEHGKPSPLESVMSWSSQLLRALNYAHGRGVVHRDVKPDNLLIDAQGQLKITDFGIARIDASTLTQVGSMVGTPCYMSPEQFRGEVADRRSDIFACGILLYQMLTGYRPYSGAPYEIMHKIMHEDAPVPSDKNPALGKMYDALIRKALARAPQERFDTCLELLEALLAIYRSGIGYINNAAEDRTQLVANPLVARTPAPVEPEAAPGTAINSSAGTMVSQSNPPATLLSSELAAQPWKADALPELESILSTQIGPMARVFLKKSLAQANDMDALCDSLLQHIPSEKGRADFNDKVQLLKKKLRSSQSSQTGLGSKLSSPGTAISSGAALATQLNSLPQDVLDAAEKKLTPFIGPIAKVMCKRTARQTGNEHEFYRLLASHIENEAERSRFLRECGLSG